MSWAAIGAAFLKALAAGLQWLLNRQQIDAGKAEQKAADQAAADHERETRDEVDQRIDAASDAELERLRDKWTRRP